jgi:hypothetical protein
MVIIHPSEMEKLSLRRGLTFPVIQLLSDGARSGGSMTTEHMLLTSKLTLLSFSFLICKLEIVIVVTSQLLR